MAIVLGGGLSGLSAAYYLLKKFGQPTAIFEASSRIGGWIKTEKHKDRGFIFEAGPRTIRPKGISGANTLEMIEDLQLPIEAVTSSHVAAKNRMIYAKGQLCMLPNSLKGVLQTIPPFSQPLAMALFNDLKSGPKKIKFGDESIYDFVSRRFGKELADYAISPMICGICAGDAKEISVRFLMDELFDKEQRYGGVMKGIFLSKLNDKKKDNAGTSKGLFQDKQPTMFKEAVKNKWTMYRVNDGLETLPRTLNDYLLAKNVEVNLTSECREIVFGENSVRLNIKGQDVEAKHVVSSIPSFKLAACVKDQHPGLAGQLMAIPYVDVAVVNLQYNSKDLLKQPAFGFLVPPLEKRPILGVIFDSCIFDMEENTVITVMMGGKWFEQYYGQNPTQKDLLDIALREVSQILGIEQEPKMSRVHILKKCIPQYNVGHKQRVQDIRRYIQRYKLPISLCGAAYDGVGINDVILSARMSVEGMPVLH
ncbi:protoporphyrinogen oxidase-like [Musca domestica]|uniref:Protoporphyrinogen oxidase n=1 Tax=Musca domestica TaxID=7370 RepID=A0ABM3V6K0_MUSDO|nr:protoporphyrinogen oxidase-like [Musca domestica]